MLNHSRVKACGVMQLRPLFLIFHNKVGEPNLQFVAVLQNHRRCLTPTVDVRAMGRIEIPQDDIGTVTRQFAMPTAEPAVVDPNAGDSAAAKFDGKPIDGDFTRRGQRVLAKELDLHGRCKESSQAGVGGREAGELAKKPLHTLDLWIVHPPNRVSMAA